MIVNAWSIKVGKTVAEHVGQRCMLLMLDKSACIAKHQAEEQLDHPPADVTSMT